MIGNYLLSKNSIISEALDCLTNAKGLGLIVVDEKKSLVGTITDGDIRRAITAGKSLNDSIESIVFKDPATALITTGKDELLKIVNDKRIKLVPILDNGVVVDVFTVDINETKDIPVILMAGGLGSRLGELTKDCPKPMLKVGGKPVLERIIENFTRVGFKKFYISVNFKAEMIEEYFKDGKSLDCDIEYLREDMRLGTGGSLSLLPDDVSGPMVVMNGDLLTLVDFRRLVSFHLAHKSGITMCTRQFEMQVPYGVVNIEDGIVHSMEEKPTHSFNVNAGVYMMDAAYLKDIKKDIYLDMPTYVHRLMDKNLKVHCFPMIEKWIDIGKASDLDYARNVYKDSL